MKTAALVRGPSTDEGTFGNLTVDDRSDVLALLSLELPWRDLNNDGIGDPNLSCITPGSYLCLWHESPTFGWCYEVTGVSGRSHILIHPANFAGDIRKGFVSQLRGCIALGFAQGHLRPDPKKFPHATKTQRALVRDEDGRGSRAAVECLEAWGAEQPFQLIIK